MYDKESDLVKLTDNRVEGVWGIHSRNVEQAMALDALLDDSIRLVTISGQAGTGKTLMAIAAGLQKTTDEDIYQKAPSFKTSFPTR